MGKFATGGLSGGVSWAFVGLDVLDSLFYDQNRIDEMLNHSLDSLSLSQKLAREGHYFDALNMQLLAADQMGHASRAQAGHLLAHIPDYIANGVKWGLDQLPKWEPSSPIDANKNIMIKGDIVPNCSAAKCDFTNTMFYNNTNELPLTPYHNWINTSRSVYNDDGTAVQNWLDLYNAGGVAAVNKQVLKSLRIW